MQFSSLSPILMQWVGASPLLLVYLGGLAVVGVFWKRYPQPALYALLGLSIHLAITFAQPLTTTWLIQNQVRTAQGVGSVQSQYAMIALVFSLGRAIGYGLLLAAIFCDRSRTVPPPDTYPSPNTY